MRSLALILLCSSVAFEAGAQNASAPVWHVLNDSVFMALGLTADQVKRIKAIDVDHEKARIKTTNDHRLTALRQKQRMASLIADREKDVQRILSKEQFAKWLGRDAEGNVRPCSECSRNSGGRDPLAFAQRAHPRG